MPISDGRITTENLCTGSVQERNIAADAVTSSAIADGAVSITAFASGINPVQVVSSLPSSADEGDMAYLTTDKKLYRYDGAAWTVEVDGVDIKANSITAGQIAAGAVKTDELDANAVTAAKIAVGTITATELASDAVTADKIAAGEITVEKLVIGSFDNLIQNPGAESGSLSPHSPNNSGATTGWAYQASTLSRSGGARFRYYQSGQSGNAYLRLNGDPTDISSHVSAASGDVFYMELYAAKIGTGTPNGVAAHISFFDETGTTTGSTTGTKTTVAESPTQTIATCEATAPSGTAYVVFNILVYNDGNATDLVFDDLYARRKVGQLVIEDQAVDYDRMEDGVWVNSQRASNPSSVTLTTSKTTVATATHTIPSWVGYLEVFAAGGAIIFNRSALQLSLYVQFGSASIGSQSDMIPGSSSETDTLNVIDRYAVSAPGSSLDVKLVGDVASTNYTVSAGYGSINSIAIGTR